MNIQPFGCRDFVSQLRLSRCARLGKPVLPPKYGDPVTSPPWLCLKQASVIRDTSSTPADYHRDRERTDSVTAQYRVHDHPGGVPDRG